MKLILGIDEVGRGPYAGPLVMGACVLKPRYDENDELIYEEIWQEDLKDSKKLSRNRRKTLEGEIHEKALAYGIGWVPAKELNEVGLTFGLRLACLRAVEDLVEDFPDVEFDEIIIDGQDNFLVDTEYEDMVTAVVKADDKVKEVSAASIIAKVAHDEYMFEVAERYPEYGFENHVGYGTPQHIAALENYGVCPEHRLFLKPTAKAAGVPLKKFTTPRKNTSFLGGKAEEKVAEYLKSQGHKILARNYRTKFYEIDIVSATKDHVYFTEVKYRKNHKYGDPLEFIDAKKRQKMTLGAESFMKTLAKKLPGKTLPSPILAAAAVFGEDFQIKKWLEITD